MGDRKGEVRRNILFATTPETRATLEAEADADHRSLSRFVDLLVQEALARRAEMREDNA